ncbi:MAG: coenzyme F420-0:L-glutamate ligase [Geminicoccaceae bacterium]
MGTPSRSDCLTLLALPGIPSIEEGDDLGLILGDALDALEIPVRSSDVLVVTHKIISKADGRIVDLNTIEPSSAAEELALATGKSPAFCEVVLGESRRIIRRRRGLIIAEHRLGMIMANAGIDRSNVTGSPDDESVLLLPENPDQRAADLANALSARFGVKLAVVVSDSVGRAWRRGVVGLALGAANLPALMDLRGRLDRDGRPLAVTDVGLADEIASAAELLMGEADEGQPAVLVSGLRLDCRDRPARDLQRPADEDLFR